MSSLRLSVLLPPLSNPKFNPHKTKPCKFARCSLSVISDPVQLKSTAGVENNRPLAAENSRTIMELANVGTLSTISEGGWPLGLGVQFAVDAQGTPILCLNEWYAGFLGEDLRVSFHVQLDQCKMRTPQCTIQGRVNKLEDMILLKKFHSAWEKRFGEVNADLLYVVNVDQVLHVDNFKEAGIWVTPTDYKDAAPDPLRDIAEKFANELNTNNVEELLRFCNVYADLDFQVLDAKVIWIDRLGFDLRLTSQKEVYEVRIPFPREVTDEKGAKSSFNCMSQLAWEVEKNYTVPDFNKVTQFKRVL